MILQSCTDRILSLDSSCTPVSEESLVSRAFVDDFKMAFSASKQISLVNKCHDGFVCLTNRIKQVNEILIIDRVISEKAQILKIVNPQNSTQKERFSEEWNTFHSKARERIQTLELIRKAEAIGILTLDIWSQIFSLLSLKNNLAFRLVSKLCLAILDSTKLPVLEAKIHAACQSLFERYASLKLDDVSIKDMMPIITIEIPKSIICQIDNHESFIHSYKKAQRALANEIIERKDLEYQLIQYLLEKPLEDFPNVGMNVITTHLQILMWIHKVQGDETVVTNTVMKVSEKFEAQKRLLKPHGIKLLSDWFIDRASDALKIQALDCKWSSEALSKVFPSPEVQLICVIANFLKWHLELVISKQNESFKTKQDVSIQDLSFAMALIDKFGENIWMGKGEEMGFLRHALHRSHDFDGKLLKLVRTLIETRGDTLQPFTRDFFYAIILQSDFEDLNLPGAIELLKEKFKNFKTLIVEDTLRYTMCMENYRFFNTADLDSLILFLELISTIINGNHRMFLMSEIIAKLSTRPNFEERVNQITASLNGFAKECFLSALQAHLREQ